MPRTRVCGGFHPRVLSLPQKSPQDPVALVVLRLHVAAERPGEQCDDIVDLRASSLERCEEGAQCPALIRGEITSESAVEDATDVGLECGTECRVEHELGEGSETAACIRVGDVVDSAEDFVDD